MIAAHKPFPILRELKTMNRGFLLGVLSVLCLTAQAGPQINVGTVYDYLDAD